MPALLKALEKLLKAVAEGAVEKAKSTADAKGLVLSFSADSGVSYTFNGDKGKIGDNVFRNVIDNAINYTPSGSVATFPGLSHVNPERIFPCNGSFKAINSPFNS